MNVFILQNWVHSTCCFGSKSNILERRRIHNCHHSTLLTQLMHNPALCSSHTRRRQEEHFIRVRVACSLSHIAHLARVCSFMIWTVGSILVTPKKFSILLRKSSLKDCDSNRRRKWLSTKQNPNFFKNWHRLSFSFAAFKLYNTKALIPAWSNILKKNLSGQRLVPRAVVYVWHFWSNASVPPLLLLYVIIISGFCVVSLIAGLWCSDESKRTILFILGTKESSVSSCVKTKWDDPTSALAFKFAGISRLFFLLLQCPKTHCPCHRR